MEPDEEEYWMRRALLLGGGGNRPITACDPTAHAEIRALRAAATSAGDDWLSGSALYVILESCLMCTGALVHARVSRLVFTARDNLGQGVGTVEELLALPWLNHRVPVVQGPLPKRRLPCCRFLPAAPLPVSQAGFTLRA